jgi:hypothetical protein
MMSAMIHRPLQHGYEIELGSYLIGIDLSSICFPILLKLHKTTTAQPEIADSASPIGILAFYSVIIIGVTIAFIA